MENDPNKPVTTPAAPTGTAGPGTPGTLDAATLQQMLHESQSMIGRQANEIGELRRMVATLQAKPSAPSVPATPTTPSAPTSTTPPTVSGEPSGTTKTEEDPLKSLTRDEAEILEANWKKLSPSEKAALIAAAPGSSATEKVGAVRRAMLSEFRKAFVVPPNTLFADTPSPLVTTPQTQMAEAFSAMIAKVLNSADSRVHAIPFYPQPRQGAVPLMTLPADEPRETAVRGAGGVRELLAGRK